MIRVSRSPALLLVCCLALVVVCAGCGKKEDIIVKTADGTKLTASDIDANPLALLPGGTLGVINVDAPQLFASSGGAQLLEISKSRLPLPVSAGFVPERDLRRLVIGLYSFQGVDVLGVATGDFNPEAIEDAASKSETTPLGTPLVRVQYAGRVFYVSANIGFVVLTSHTVLFGNETGIRRALDRLEAGRVANELRPEVDTLMRSPGAPVAFASDAANDPQVGALASQLRFFRGMTMLRVIGNFDAPGVNLAGTLTYADEALANNAQASLVELRDNMAAIGLLTSFFGVSNPIAGLDANVVGNSVQMSVAFDARGAATLIELFAKFAGSGEAK